MMDVQMITAIAAIPVGSLAIYLFYKAFRETNTLFHTVLTNHLQHSTEASNHLARAVNENTAVMREMKGFLEAVLREKVGTITK